MNKFSNKQNGFAHLQLLLIAIVVVASIAGVGAYVIRNSRAETLSTSSSVSNHYGCHSQPTLSTGSSGACVKYLQWCLNRVDSEKLVIDGAFGNSTYNAVKRFQKNHNLKVDGIVGAKTWSSLLLLADLG